MDESKSTKPPKAVSEYMISTGESLEGARDYIKTQLRFFSEIPYKTTSESGWIALKLDCTEKRAEGAIKWARR